jgi:hypothetical protein
MNILKEGFKIPVKTTPSFVWSSSAARTTRRASSSLSQSTARAPSKKVKKLSQICLKAAKKLSRSCKKVVKKLSKSCQKFSKRCQKVVKNVFQKLPKIVPPGRRRPQKPFCLLLVDLAKPDLKSVPPLRFPTPVSHFR